MILNKCVQETNGFYTNKKYSEETDSIDIHLHHYQELKSAGFFGKNLGQRKEENSDGGLFNGIFLAPN